jgi:hypothetical protein
LLDPSTRQIYTDQLTPPEGYHLDRALATTFSLDLMSLLMAPISMTLEDYRLNGKVTNDPVAVIEALHRSADRFLVFCQKGRIAIPSQDTLLYNYLESSVIEVQAPNPEGVFHPKTWLLRFVANEINDSVIYRFLCLSKNLTFDQSWDTVLALEGRLDSKRIRGFGLNRPLGQFIQSLPDLANNKVSEQTETTVTKMAEEVRKVHFEPPDEFEKISQFIPVGIPGHARFPKIQGYKRALILSPFLSAGPLQKLTNSGKENTVISRLEAFEGLAKKTRESIMENAGFFILNEAAEKPEEAEADDDGFSSLVETEDFSGLHAKMIITENGSQARVYTGSANITNAAFSGKNVEFSVALNGEKNRVGINRFLGDENSGVSFRNMLIPYESSQDESPSNDLQVILEKILELGRKNLFMALFAREQNFSLPDEITCSCYPITIPENRSKDFEELKKQGKIIFSDLTPEALTRFLAFRLTAKKSGEKAGISFVLNLPVEGMPAERDKHVLHRILSDPETFIRYLLFILGTDDFPGLNKETGKGHGKGVAGQGFLLPLFEEMVRAYSRDPEKIDRISEIIKDLKEAGNLDNILPEGFENIWKAFERETTKDL